MRTHFHLPEVSARSRCGTLISINRDTVCSMRQGCGIFC
jgi:hypothetical protein